MSIALTDFPMTDFAAYTQFVTENGRPDLAQDDPNAMEPNQEKRFAMIYFTMIGEGRADWAMLQKILEVVNATPGFEECFLKLREVMGSQDYETVFG